jgi:hypothetical protein
VLPQKGECRTHWLCCLLPGRSVTAVDEMRWISIASESLYAAVTVGSAIAKADAYHHSNLQKVCRLA